MDFPVNLEMWQLIVGVGLPLLIAVVIKPDWPSLTKWWVGFAMCFVVSIGDVWFSGHFVLVDLGGTLLKVVFLCFTSYLTIWKPSGIAEGIEKRVLGGKKFVIVACLAMPLAAGGALSLNGCTAGTKWIRPGGELVAYEDLTPDEKNRVKVDMYQDQIDSLWTNSKAFVDIVPDDVAIQQAWKEKAVPAFDAVNKTIADVITQAQDGDLTWEDASKIIMPAYNRVLALLIKYGLIIVE